jgi:hypothetical protein
VGGEVVLHGGARDRERAADDDSQTLGDNGG